MKKLAKSLLIINLVVFAWLIIGAKMELPPWKEAFENAKNSINLMKEHDRIGEDEHDILQRCLEMAKTYSRLTIEEYQRSDGPLGALTVLNIIGLSIIVFWNRKGTKQGVISGSEKP
jgi:hypothetical protein